MADKCERCGNHNHVDGHPDRPFCDLGDENQSAYLRDLLMNYTAGFKVDPPDMFPQYDLFVKGLPTFVTGAWLLECAFKLLIRSKNNWEVGKTKTHHLDILFAELDDNSKGVFGKHLRALRLSVAGWPNPRETIEDFLKDHSRSWEVYRYAPIEKIDMNKNPAYPLLEIRELCIAAIRALHGRESSQYGTLPDRVLLYMQNDFKRDLEDRWYRNQGGVGEIIRPDHSDGKLNSMRRIDMALWENGVFSSAEYALIRMENELIRQVDEFAQAIEMTQLGNRVGDSDNPGEFITPLDQYLRDSSWR